MTDADKKKLIDKLGAAGNKAFDPRYTGDNRKWFVGKIIDSLLHQNVPDADIEKKTSDIIVASADQVKKRLKKGFPSGSLGGKWDLYNNLKSRTQIIYGMIAMHPEFLDPAHTDYFDFILERRYRAIQRMHFYVNPNSTRYIFGYPASAQKMKVNKSATDMNLWKPYLDGSVPFLLTPVGSKDPANAVEVLFTKQDKAQDRKLRTDSRNLFSCDPVAGTLHMDALRAAKDEKVLLKALAKLGDQYLKIDHPFGHCANNYSGQRLVAVSSAPAKKGDHVDIQVGRTGLILQIIEEQLGAVVLTEDNYIALNRPKLKFMIVLGDVQETFTVQAVDPATKMVRAEHLKNDYNQAGARIYVTTLTFPFYSSLPYHFITDDRPDHAFFEQLTLKSVDLQVGDHIYVINHPLYKIYYPTGAWGGEHSFITEIGSRDTSGNMFKNDLRVEGHGVSNESLLGMSKQMLLFINNILSKLQTVTPVHLKNLKANGRKSGTVGSFKVTFTTRKEQFSPDSNPINVNVFEYTGAITYKVIDPGTGKKISEPNPGFVIKEPVDNQDAEFWVYNFNGTDSSINLGNPVPIRKVAFIGSGSAERFTLSKWAVRWFNTQTTRFEFLPLFNTDNKTPMRLTFNELMLSKPFLAMDDQGDVYVTRPRVNFDSAYQTFLKNNGAI